jgi:hypothetical protein
MESNKNNKHDISRKKFLQICGSVLAGGSILGVGGALLHKNVIPSENNLIPKEGATRLDKGTDSSPYKLVSSFSVPGKVECFELYNDKLIVAASNSIFIYDQMGALLNNFAVGDNLRDIAVENDFIYLLFPTRIEVRNEHGDRLQEWEACSEQSDYCSFTTAPGFVFVTDAANKNICKYTNEGNFVKFIKSPNNFIIPSYTFGITHIDGTIYCSNSGRHQIESYTLDGDYISSFGKAGGATGMFCGCCNPVHLAHTSTGEIITSEKGNPRISCYSSDGKFRSLLLDSKILGGGNTAYDVKVHEDKLYVAGKNLISTFQYDRILAAKTACSDCGVDCPLRRGITI